MHDANPRRSNPGSAVRSAVVILAFTTALTAAYTLAVTALAAADLNIDGLADVMDMSSRFATYRAATDYGIQPTDAARLALDSSLNLTRRGEDARKLDLIVPFFKTISYPLGVWGFIALTYFVIVGTSNAVNLTDGLDGLAIMPTVMVGSALGLFAYLTGSATYAKYLLIPHIPGAGELLIFCGAMAGAGLAFLWFNAYPAQVFMGDVGALALGGALGTIAVIVRQEIVLFIMGGVFVVETLSVMLQVAYFKYTKMKTGVGKRVLLMAPLHHHYEQKGWKETQVVVRFWIITMMLVLIG